MKQNLNLEDINEVINTGQPVLLYFSGENCSVCKVLKPKIDKAVSEQLPYFNLIEIKTDEQLLLSREFSIFSIPTTIIYFDKKEFKRYGRNMSVQLFIDEIKRPYKLMLE
ncbi:MAG: thioredoxin family protein [Sulfurovum sp.]|jgi:thioredoxin-like negative regulator of GroEL